MAAVNLAGCVFFMISAVAVLRRPRHRLDPRPRRRQLEHRARRRVLPRRLRDARPPPTRSHLMTIHQPASTNGGDVAERLETLARQYGNRFLREAAPDHQLPEHGMTATDAMRLIEEDLVLDGIPMRNLATFVTTWMEPEARAADRREPAPQLHRPRRVSADGGDRAALHPHARPPVPRARRDDRRALPGIVGGDHARRAVAEVEVAPAPRGGRQGHEPAEPDLRRRRARRVGEVLPLLRRRAAHHPAAARQVHDRPRGRRAPRRREHDRGRRRGGHHVHRPRRRRPRHQRPARPAARREGARRPAARRRRQRRLRVAVPVPRLGVGLPARAGPLDQRLRAQVRARLPGHRLARSSASAPTWPRTSSSTRTTSARPTRRSR